MKVILGEKVADHIGEYYSDHSWDHVHKWWQCPRCRKDFVFEFNSFAPWPPLELKCPNCELESPIPWAEPSMVTWKCEQCGMAQRVSRSCWESPMKDYESIEFDPDIRKEGRIIRCFACEDWPDHGPVDKAIDSFFGFLDIFFDPKKTAKNALSQGWSQRRKEAEEAERKFDSFLRKVPQLRAEQARLSVERRQRIALQAKAQQEELKLLKKQAGTAIGLKRMKPTNFELAVASLYLKLGYKVYTTPASGDQGIDLIAIKDKQQIAVQCKRYKRTVPVSQVRDFYGSFVGSYTRGIFVTSSIFSKATREWAKEREGLELLNGRQLAKLFVEHDPKIERNVEKWKEHPPDRE